MRRCVIPRLSKLLPRQLPRSSQHTLRRQLTSLSNPFKPTVQPWRNPQTYIPCHVVLSSSTYTIVGVALFTALVGAVTVIYQKPQPASTHPLPGSEAEELKTLEEMAAVAGTPQPGRPGNLTAEQELKLKEFWSTLLHIFGVSDPADASNGDADSINSQARTNVAGAEKKKSKKRGLFGRKTNADAGADGAAAAADGDDKYGQLKDFHALLDKQPPEELRKAFWSMVKHDNPDGLLLRFLRARKWNVQNALVMLMATIHWRLEEAKVDIDIIKRGEGGALEDSKSSDAAVKRDGSDFLTQIQMGKSFLHGTDKEGRPMCFVRVRLHKQGEQTEASQERYTVYTIETARLLLSGNVDTAVS